jgi:N-methylhydantoinase B/oxoprolinase/acetone carboxylase alpha subunit
MEIIKDALVAIGDEMFVALQRTSMSTIIYEVLDYACGLTDNKARLISQGNGVAGFLGTLTFGVQSVLDKFGLDGLEPGDIILQNDPYTGGGTHLSDVALIMPIFYDGKVVAFSANKGHWTEVGGKDAGSWTTDSTEVYQEGLQFPCIKLYKGGEIDQSLVDLIAANVRTPDMTLGDMYAQAASLRLGERRFKEMCDKYGVEVVLAGIEALLDYGEEMTRRELAKLPKGVYEAVDYIDDDGIGNGPFEVRVKVTITDDEFICDFTGTHPQVPGPVNCTRTGLHSGVRTIFNLAGPLANPASPPFHVVGAYSPSSARMLADTLAGMPLRRAYVIHGAAGWDEPTPVGPYLLFEVTPGKVEARTEDPARFGLERCAPDELAGGDPGHNAAALLRVVEGERGAHRDALLLGASLALRVTGMVPDPEEALARAAAVLDDGRALELVQRLATEAASV